MTSHQLALSAAQGFATGLGLIVAIGAQNAFVLRQGLMRQHVGVTVAFCAISDALLIAAGVGGLGRLLQVWPGVLYWMRWAGVVFLLAYGFMAARRALRPSHLNAAPVNSASLVRSLALVAGFTWLNPHVYLDTVLLVGSLAHSGRGHPWAFGAGAMASSVAWFVTLGFGARVLQPVFAKPRAWQWLDAGIACTMFALAGVLLRGHWA